MKNVETGGKIVIWKGSQGDSCPEALPGQSSFHDRTRHGNTRKTEIATHNERGRGLHRSDGGRKKEKSAHAGSLTSYPFKIETRMILRSFDRDQNSVIGSSNRFESLLYIWRHMRIASNLIRILKLLKVPISPKLFVIHRNSNFPHFL